jgi:hypothetical protein
MFVCAELLYKSVVAIGKGWDGSKILQVIQSDQSVRIPLNGVGQGRFKFEQDMAL